MYRVPHPLEVAPGAFTGSNPALQGYGVEAPFVQHPIGPRRAGGPPLQQHTYAHVDPRYVSDRVTAWHRNGPQPPPDPRALARTAGGPLRITLEHDETKTAGGCGNWASFPKYAGGVGHSATAIEHPASAAEVLRFAGDPHTFAHGDLRYVGDRVTSWHRGDPRTAGGVGTVAAGVVFGSLVAVLVAGGVAIAWAYYAVKKFLENLPKGCEPLEPGGQPHLGWSVADTSAILPAAQAAFGDDYGKQLVDYLTQQGWRCQCAPGA